MCKHTKFILAKNTFCKKSTRVNIKLQDKLAITSNK